MQFYAGVFNIVDVHKVKRAFVSVNRLRARKSDFRAQDWILDSGAFTELERHGRYREGPEAYARQATRWSTCGNMLAAVSQDYMCEPFMLARTGMTVEQHQALTIERYIAIKRLAPTVYIMPVVQGYQPEEYVFHVKQYGELLTQGQWVGVGSVCKRNSKPELVAAVLRAIKQERPDLRLHGFGVKRTALARGDIRDMLYSSDSMAWSYAAWREGRSVHDIQGAIDYASAIEKQPYQLALSI